MEKPTEEVLEGHEQTGQDPVASKSSQGRGGTMVTGVEGLYQSEGREGEATHHAVRHEAWGEG